MKYSVTSKIKNILCNKLSCNQNKLNEYSLIEKILETKFNEISRLKTDCFRINELDYFLGDTSNCTNPKVEVLLTNLFIETNLPNPKKLDIKKITTIYSSWSKSSGYSYESIYLFGAEFIKLGKYTSLSFNQLINDILKCHKNSLKVHYYSWLNQCEWINNDRSHRFALATYYAYEKNIVYNADVSIISYEMDTKNFNELLKKYELFILNKNTLYEITKHFSNHETYFTCELINENILIGFDKNNFNFDNIIELFKKFDENFVLNFNAYIKSLLNNQLKYKKSNILTP